MASGKYLFTSESVSMGHPDKLADQISDGVLDALLAQDPMSRVACETMVTTGVAIVAGEITTKAVIDYPTVVRQVIREVGYTDDEVGINADTCAVMVSHRQAEPRHRPGRERRRRERQGHWRWRPGPDVRLCLQRHARADAAADRAVAPHSESADRSPTEGRGEVAASGQQEPGDDRVRRATARSGSTRSSSRRSTAPKSRTKRFASS